CFSCVSSLLSFLSLLSLLSLVSLVSLISLSCLSSLVCFLFSLLDEFSFSFSNSARLLESFRAFGVSRKNFHKSISPFLFTHLFLSNATFSFQPTKFL